MNQSPRKSSQWKTNSQNPSMMRNSTSNKSLFKTLNNTHHLMSYLKNGLTLTQSGKGQKRIPDNGMSTLKRKVLDLKVKLSSLQGERARKDELESRLSHLQQKKRKEETDQRNELEQLMRTLSALKGDLAEQKTRLQRMELKREMKTQDLKKMEELIQAKGEELVDLKEKYTEECKLKNDLLAERDSLEKEMFLLNEESNKIDIESVRLERELREAQSRQKVALEQTERIQSIFESRNEQLIDSELNNKNTKEQVEDIKKRVAEMEEQKNDIENSLRDVRSEIEDLKAQKENLKKQNNNFNMVNVRKNFDLNDFAEEQEALEISNR
jgi:chromosome segregation ATPase